MKPPLYREALTHSWHLAWKEHSLWPFGLFAAMLGQMGIIDALVQLWFTARGYRPGSGFVTLFDFFTTGFSGTTIPYGMIGWIAFLSIVCVGLGLVMTFLAVVSQATLVHSTAHRVHHKRLPEPGVSWHSGVQVFWKVFALNVLKKSILGGVGILIALMSWPILFSLGGSPVLFLFVFLFSAIVSLVVSILAVYAIGYIVVERYSLLRSIREAWQLFVEHWLVSLEVGFVIFLFDLLVSFLLVALLFLSFLPAFVGYLLGLLLSSTVLFTIGIAVSATLFLVMLFLVSSVFSTFTIAMWTYLFMQMHKTGLKSHVLHWLGR
ncbi:MAG: hypothetical protein ACD_48C00132G0001 [uncultured bacterium]|nr:MAG: hypothetical protein ACD_48C00132G0001 [uncultured bacterium]